jgi:uncharacterized protein involved in exopolysaccharide biosynthesis
MDSSESLVVVSNKSLLRTHRDVLAIGFRHRRLIVISFVGILLGGLIVALLQPREYRSHMEILVTRDRAESLITPGATTATEYDAAVTQEEINSEVELLKSRDLLEKVVVACALDRSQQVSAWPGFLHRLRPQDSSPQEAALRTSYALQRLEKDISISVVPNTDVIAVGYESVDPQVAVRVLRTLASGYLKKHVLVHRSPGAFDFFLHQANRFAQQLTAAEVSLVQFNRAHSVVSAEAEETAALDKLAEFRANLHQTQAQISATTQRIAALENQVASTPIRVATKVVTSKDATLLENLKSTLLSLQLQRTQLLVKFDPEYPPVRALSTEIAETQSAISNAEKTEHRETTTDRDLTYEWEDEELARAKADLASLQAQATADEQTVRAYEQRSQLLGQQAVTQGNLAMSVKTAEQNYLLYRSKEEEARINDALDRQRIVNVAIAEAPTVPFLPANHRSLTVVLAGLLACVVSGGLALGAESLDTTFRTPDEVSTFLAIPVVAALPRASDDSEGEANGGTTADH